MFKKSQFSVNNENSNISSFTYSPLVYKKFLTKEKIKSERRTSNTNDTRKELISSPNFISLSISPITKRNSLSNGPLFSRSSCSIFSKANVSNSNTKLTEPVQMKSSFPSMFLKDLEARMTNHRLLPVDKTNDEVFKQVLICNKLKRPQVPKFNSDYCKKRLYRELNQAKKSEPFLNKEFHSVKKTYSSTIKFIGEDKKTIKFNIYKDENVIRDNTKFSALLQINDQDNDIATESDTINYASRVVMHQLEAAMLTFSPTKDLSRMKLNSTS